MQFRYTPTASNAGLFKFTFMPKILPSEMKAEPDLRLVWDEPW